MRGIHIVFHLLPSPDFPTLPHRLSRALWLIRWGLL
jgi:hypothetical protein